VWGSVVDHVKPVHKSEGAPWQTVYGYFRAWRIAGIWDHLRDLAREQEGRERQPTAAILDRQTVKTTDRGGPERGTDIRMTRKASAGF